MYIIYQGLYVYLVDWGYPTQKDRYHAKFDHLVPPEACERLTGAVGSRDVEDICLDTGHIGIYVSSRFQKEFAPRIAAWLKERDGAKKVGKAPSSKFQSDYRSYSAKVILC